MPLSDADQELMELQRSVHTQGVNAGVSADAVAADPQAVKVWEMRRAAQREAYGQFVALAPIHYAGVLVFNTGQQVPLEHVINYDLEDQELVARVATPEQARVGKTFESDDDYHQANPHVRRRSAVAPELHPSALDPRGAAADKDDARKAGKANPTMPADPDARAAVAGDVMADLRDNPPDDDDKPARGGSRGKSAGKAE